MQYDGSLGSDAYLEELRKRNQMMESQGAQSMAPSIPSSSPGGSAQPMAEADKESIVGSLLKGGAMGGAGGGVAGAGIGAGAGLAAAYLNNKAAAERQKRDRAAQIAQQYGEDQYKGFMIAQDALRGAFR